MVGGTIGYVAGGTAKSAFFGALSGATFGWVGDMSAGWNVYATAYMHGIAGGVSSGLAGGDFTSGFLGSAFGTLAGVAQVNDIYDRGILRTIVGGIAAEIGGGKFSNGALTAAYGYLFNEVAHPKKTLLGEVNGRGSSETFDAGRTIRIEPYSHTIGVDFFTYEVDYRYYDSDGRLMLMALPLNEFGKPIPAFTGHVVTGQGGGGPDLTFTAPELKVDGASGRIQWRVTIPHQIETHQNSMGWNLRVYRVD